MADEQDERFAKVYQDPRFRTLRKKDRTLKIDKRFKSMFTEDRFKLKYSMDKRGRSKKHLIAEDYKKFYRVEDDENDTNNEKQDNQNVNDNNSLDEEKEKVPLENDVQNNLNLTHKFGYHRGLEIKSKDVDDESNQSSSSSSSSSESEDEDDDEESELEHDWGELDKDAPQIDHATPRIAICNADWDRINAQDLFVLVNSFKPPMGNIKSVRVYYSKFGEERLKIEEERGPSQFIFGKSGNITTIENDNDDEPSDNEEEDDDDGGGGENNKSDKEDDEDQDPESVEKLRKYQLERLKYFYAVVECDTAKCADVIYKELDGLEYESSSTTLDIRFIPDDMNFDDVRIKEECCSMPTSVYKAPSFTNTALQQSNVKITWDETDPRRREAFDKAFDEDNEDDIKAYLATSSSDEASDNETDEEIDENLKDSDKIDKYKKLLQSLDRENSNNLDMEVQWEPKLKSNTTDLLLSNNKTDHSDDDNNVDHSIQDDDSQEELIKSKNIKKNNNKKNKFKSKHDKNKISLDDDDDNQDANDLELLMMDVENNIDGDKRKHFNYKDIVENFEKNKNKDIEDDDADGFKFDPDDSRFNSIYNSHLFNIDQSDPNFKRTKAFNEILKKQKQKATWLIENEQTNDNEKSITTPKTNGHVEDEGKRKTLNTLVRKIKNKTNECFNERQTKNYSNNGKKFNPNKKFKC